MTFFELRGLAITKICKKTNQNKKWLFSQIFLQCNVSTMGLPVVSIGNIRVNATQTNDVTP